MQSKEGQSNVRAKNLTQGGVIGICSPCHIADYDDYQNTIQAIRACGFEVREGKNLYKNTYGYAATPEERAADFNQFVADPEVELIFFGGGEAGNELLPYIDFEKLKENPKRVCSYSDGTFLLDPIWAITGLETYYGQSPHMFLQMQDYDAKHFWEHLIQDCMEEHIPNSAWRVQTRGVAEGILVGGYARNFAMILGSKYFPWNREEDYVLFIEDHDSFGGVDYYSAMLTHIEQDEFMAHVKGLIIGNYSEEEHPELLARIKRIGEKYQIPTVYCDDFGHGKNHAILPIGRKVRLDTEKVILQYL